MRIATTLFTYVWHYVVARLLYDDLLSPLIEERLIALVPLAVIVASVLLVARSLRRMRSRRPR